MKKLILLFALAFMATAQAQSGREVSGVAINRATKNVSVAITLGNTFQTVLNSIVGTSTIRQALTVQNNNIAENCWLHIGVSNVASTANSILLGPGGSYQRYWPFVPSDAFQATCATTNDTLYIDVQ